jgi:hypothetical protein
MIPVRAALRASLMPMRSWIGPTPLKEMTALPSSFLGSTAGLAAALAAGRRARRATTAANRHMARP